MNRRLSYWITNGVNTEDPDLVIYNSNELRRCNHCYNKRNCFTSIGNMNHYAICKSCLYNPASNMVNHNFINVSRSKQPDYFISLLFGYRCSNRKEYLEFIEGHN